MKDTKEYIVPARGHFISVIKEAEYFPKHNVLKITWVSDGLNDDDVKEYINKRFPQLASKKVLNIFHDDPWHFTQDGAAYALIFVFFAEQENP